MMLAYGHNFWPPTQLRQRNEKVVEETFWNEENKSNITFFWEYAVVGSHSGDDGDLCLTIEKSVKS